MKKGNIRGQGPRGKNRVNRKRRRKTKKRVNRKRRRKTKRRVNRRRRRKTINKTMNKTPERKHGQHPAWYTWMDTPTRDQQ